MPDPEPLSLSDLSKARLSESVYETLLDAILSGRLAPGTVISEVSLARDLNVSRTPVHDAMRELVKDGLVLQEPNRRPVIAKFSGEDIRDIFDMRVLLEGESAFRAATRIDRPTLARLRSATDALTDTRGARDWIERWTDHDDIFHAEISRASGSMRLHQDIDRYRKLHRGLNRRHTDVTVLEPALEEHEQILNALEARDADEARRSIQEHIREWQAFFVQNIAQSGS